MSLTQKMIALIIPIFLVVFAGFGFVSIWAMGRSTQRSLEERLLLAKVAAESIDHYNRGILQQLEGLAAAIDLRTSDLEATKRLFENARTRLFAREFFLLDGGGSILVSEPQKGGLLGLNLSQRGYVGQMYQTGEPYISGTTTSIIDESWVVIYATPIKDRDGRVMGAIAAGMDLNKPSISGFVEAIKLGKTGYAQVVDGKGNLLASTQPHEVFGESDHGARFIALIQAKQAVVRTCHNCHEPEGSGLQRRKDILAFVPLSTVPWGVAVRQAEQEALAPTRDLQMGILAIGTASLLLALAAAVIFVRRLVKPLLMLTVGAQQIAAGDLSSSVQAKGRDEIGVLAGAFEVMRTRLRSSRQEIEKRTQDIERRNMELSALNDIGVEISALLDVDKTLSSVVEKARELLGADVALLTSFVEEDGKLLVKATSGARTEAFTSLLLKPGQGLAGSVVSRGQPIITEDYLGDLTILHDDEADSMVREEGLKAHLGVPLKLGGKVVGALVVAHRRVYEFQKEEENLLSRLANQAALAIENARLYEEVQRKEELRGQLLEKVISAQEEERKRIARELHDDSAQALTALAMQLEAIERDLPPELHSMRERVARQKNAANQTLEEIKKLMADLRPAALDDLGLVPAIRWYAENRLVEQGVNVVFDLSGLKSRLPLQLETTLFRVFQEAINNIAKHAEARTAWISLAIQDALVRGTVKDDGKGFDTTRVLSSPGKRAGLGLLGMQERVSLFQGTLGIQSQPGRGTKVVIEVPVSKGE